jgi:hypothetical protein
MPHGYREQKRHLPPWDGTTRREINKFTPVPESHKGVIRNFQMTCVFRLKMRADAVFLKYYFWANTNTATGKTQGF